MAEAFAEYEAEGWCVVPVKRGEKSPTLRRWPERAAAREFTANDFDGTNVGVVLGPVSGGLVDVDLDSQAAIELAPYFLPPTLTFGRKSKRASHWLYYAPGLRSDVFKFGPKPKRGTPDKREQVEIRAQNKSGDACGHQSVFPGSVHPSGERIEWDGESKEVATLDAGDLAWRVARLAVAAALLPDWAEGSHRNAKSFGVAGGLLKMGWKADEVRELLGAVRVCSGYDREEDESAVERTIEAFEAGTEVTGLGQLALDGELDAHVVQSLERNARTPTTRAIQSDIAKSKLGDSGLRAEMLEEARAVDGMVDAGNAAAEMLEAPEKKRAPRKRVERKDDDPFKNLGRLVDLGVEPEPLHYLCRGLKIAPGKVTGLAGYAGTGKGPLLTLFALCVASGQPFLGHDVKRERVCYFDFETGRLAQIRFRRIARAMGLDPVRLQREHWITFINAAGLCVDDEWIDDCRELVECLDAGLVCVDSYTSANPGEQNEASYADRLWELGAVSDELDCVMMVVFHENKDAKAVGIRKVSGTQALAAAQQTILSLTRPDDAEPSTLVLSCSRAEDDGFAPFAFKWSDVPAPETKSKGALISQGDPNKWGLCAEPTDGPTARTVTGAAAKSLASKGDAEEKRQRAIVRWVELERVCKLQSIRDTPSVVGTPASVKASCVFLYTEGVLDYEDGRYSLAPPTSKNLQARLRLGLAQKEGRKA